ncbi:hypothetical protein ES703_97779 [subsurface metagenome]
MFILIWIHGLSCWSLHYANSYTITKCAIFSVMIFLCFPLFILFQILAWLEKKNIGNEEEDPILISYVKEKTKIKGNPKTKKDICELAKTISKKIEVSNAIDEYYKTGKKAVKNMALFYAIIIANNVGLKKEPKSPAHLFKLAKKEGKLKEVAKKYDQLEKGDYDKFVEKIKPKKNE